MRLFGYDISVKAATPTKPSTWGSYGSWGGGWNGSSWWPIIREPFTGAWQKNMEERAETILTHSAVFSCITLIASDIAKLGLGLFERDDDGIWTETEATAFSPVLRKPNRYQNRIKFIEQWITSKLIHGNTYILKERDQRNVVVSLYPLDPTRTRPFVSPDGSIYYQVYTDNLSGIELPEDRVGSHVLVPQSEIIHDTMVALYHPLCGVSPITACALAASQGMAIQRNSTGLFTNGARPGGILLAPGEISDETSLRLKEYWEKNFSGSNVGRIAVLGDNLKYESLTMNAVDAQLIDQLKWSSETVCSVFHVPPYMIGIGPMPTYNNVEALNQQYYSQCLQSLIMNCQLCLNDGLGLSELVGKVYGTRFNIEDLLRMDTSTLYKTMGDGVKAAILTPNEGRLRLNKPPIEGGDTVYMQQQDFSLSALAKRDAKEDPFESEKKPAETKPAAEDPEEPPTPPEEPTKDFSLDPISITALSAWEARSGFGMTQ